MLKQISFNDGLPQNVCRKCAKRFAGQKEFRQMCDSAQDVLETYFKSIVLARGETVEPTNITNDGVAKKATDGTLFEFLNINDDYDSEENDLKRETNTEKGHSQTQENNEEMVEKKPILHAKEDFIIQIEEIKQTNNVEEEIYDEDDIDSFDGDKSQEDDLENGDEEDNDDDEQSDSENKNGLLNENLRCHICARYFRRKVKVIISFFDRFLKLFFQGNLRRHLKSHDLKNEKTAIKKKVKKRKYDHLCNKCGKRFTKSKGLQLHISASQCISEDVIHC